MKSGCKSQEESRGLDSFPQTDANELLRSVISVRRGDLQGCKRVCCQHFVNNCHRDNSSDTKQCTEQCYALWEVLFVTEALLS